MTSSVMEALGLLLLISLLKGGSCIYKSNPYCAEQRGTILVEEKGSVTIPCNFTYPKSLGRSVDVRVFWRRGLPDRCGNGVIIYKPSIGWTHSNYTGRISLVGNPIEDGTATITIRDLRRTDHATFCCRVEIYEGSKCIAGWQNPHGTYIQFKDEFSIEQPDVVPVLIGEDMIIPCITHYNASAFIEKVSWTMGTGVLCNENYQTIFTWDYDNYQLHIIGPWSVVDFPRNLSLKKTKKKVTSEDNKHYCCRVKTRLQGGSTVFPIHGTEVVVVGSTDPKFEVVQPEVTLLDTDGSATLSCSYYHQSDTDPLWTEVYWRVGSPSGIYAYHPFPEMVHSSYRGRTELRGLANLHIKGVDSKDNTTYYCFVMLKFCYGYAKFSSSIQHGSGTKLEIKRFSESPQKSQVQTVIIYVAIKNLILLVLVILYLVYLKKRSLQSDEEPDSNLQTLQTFSTENPNISNYFM